MLTLRYNDIKKRSVFSLCCYAYVMVFLLCCYFVLFTVVRDGSRKIRKRGLKKLWRQRNLASYPQHNPDCTIPLSSAEALRGFRWGESAVCSECRRNKMARAAAQWISFFCACTHLAQRIFTMNAPLGTSVEVRGTILLKRQLVTMVVRINAKRKVGGGGGRPLPWLCCSHR